jgi:hypothetical protein
MKAAIGHQDVDAIARPQLRGDESREPSAGHEPHADRERRLAWRAQDRVGAPELLALHRGPQAKMLAGKELKALAPLSRQIEGQDERTSGFGPLVENPQ